MMNSIRKFFSKFTNKPISAGYGFTNDNKLKIVNIPEELINGKPVSNITALYEINNEIGLFELIGFKRTPKGNTSITLRCNKTGDVFTVSKDLFNLLFKKHT